MVPYEPYPALFTKISIRLSFLKIRLTHCLRLPGVTFGNILCISFAATSRFCPLEVPHTLQIPFVSILLQSHIRYRWYALNQDCFFHFLLSSNNWLQVNYASCKSFFNTLFASSSWCILDHKANAIHIVLCPYSIFHITVPIWEKGSLWAIFLLFLLLTYIFLDVSSSTYINWENTLFKNCGSHLSFFLPNSLLLVNIYSNSSFLRSIPRHR